jgi:hypothetical protein
MTRDVFAFAAGVVGQVCTYPFDHGIGTAWAERDPDFWVDVPIRKTAVFCGDCKRGAVIA